MTYKNIGTYLLIGLLMTAPLAGCSQRVTWYSNLRGLTEQQVKERAVDAGYKLKVEFKYERRSGKEVVVDQYPFETKTVRKNDTVSILMADADFENAVGMAESQIQRAKELLQQCRGMGIDVLDLAPAMTQARSIYKKAKTAEELAGWEKSAVFFANTVINACNQRIAEKQSEARPGSE